MTERALRMPRIPVHVVVMLSAAAAGYAASLAGVAAMQATREGALRDERAPALAGVDRLSRGHDELDARLVAAGRSYANAADTYTQASRMLATLDQDVATLAAQVAQIDGVSRSLPTTVHVPVIRAVIPARAPATHATTGASGG